MLNFDLNSVPTNPTDQDMADALAALDTAHTTLITSDINQIGGAAHSQLVADYDAAKAYAFAVRDAGDFS